MSMCREIEILNRGPALALYVAVLNRTEIEIGASFSGGGI